MHLHHPNTNLTSVVNAFMHVLCKFLTFVNAFMQALCKFITFGNQCFGLLILPCCRMTSCHQTCRCNQSPSYTPRFACSTCASASSKHQRHLDCQCFHACSVQVPHFCQCIHASSVQVHHIWKSMLWVAHLTLLSHDFLSSDLPLQSESELHSPLRL